MLQRLLKPAWAPLRSVSLAARILPPATKNVTEKDLDEWIAAVDTLGAQPETQKQHYLEQLTNPAPFLEKGFVPTEQQQQEHDAVAEKEVHLLSEPVVDNLVNVIMRHGKKSPARRHVLRALYLVQLKTRQDPVKILAETLDKLGPLFDTETLYGALSRGTILPYPLRQRQRNRYAIVWILEAAKKRRLSDFAVRLAEELLAAHEGKLLGYDKRAQMHRLAMQNRANV